MVNTTVFNFSNHPRISNSANNDISQQEFLLCKGSLN